MTTDDSTQAIDLAAFATPSVRYDDPIFVGGTGRSGTTVTARLVGAGRSVHLIPVEIRFHVDPGGLTDIVDGRTTVDQFIGKLQTYWYRRTTAQGENRGFHSFVGDSEFREATEAFRCDGQTDPSRAARHLMGNLLDPPARANAADQWVEMTPPNVLKVSGLRTIYPSARFVHVYRDGRDVAHSVVPLPWGPNEVESALTWWEKTFVEALREMSGHEEAILLVSMEDLIIRRRSESLDQLFDFLGLPVDTGVQRYFGQHMSPERAHVGRWNQDLSLSERREMNLRYDAAVERIVREFPSIQLAL